MKTIFAKAFALALCLGYCGASAQNSISLLAYYPFSGNAGDASGNSFNGTLQGSPVLVNDRTGTPNSAYTFNGTSQIIRLGDILDSVFTKPAAAFTVTGWARSNRWAPYQGGGALVTKSEGGHFTNYQWSIQHDVDGTITGDMCYTAAASSFIEKKTAIINLNEWFHFALVFDGSQAADADRLQVYANGIPGAVSRKTGAQGTKNANTGQEITIGGGYYAATPSVANNQYQGVIDEVRIYGKALSQAEINNEINASANQVTGTGPKISVWPNPSLSGIFTVQVPLHAKVSVYDISGRRIYSAVALHDSHTIDLSAFQSGICILQVESGNALQTLKIFH